MQRRETANQSTCYCFSATNQADYAIDADDLAEAQPLTDTFQKGLPGTQSLPDARQNANTTHEEAPKARLKVLSVFKVVNPELFNGSKAARALLDSVGSKAKKAGTVGEDGFRLAYGG